MREPMATPVEECEVVTREEVEGEVEAEVLRRVLAEVRGDALDVTEGAAAPPAAARGARGGGATTTIAGAAEEAVRVRVCRRNNNITIFGSMAFLSPSPRRLAADRRHRWHRDTHTCQGSQLP